MTAKQKLAMAQAQIAYWKTVAAEAKKQLSAKPAKVARKLTKMKAARAALAR